jgi:hypothetical protein
MVASIIFRSLAWRLSIWVICSFISSAWASQGFWEAIEIAGSAIVIVGAVVEAMAELRRIPKNRKLRRKVLVVAAITLIVGLMVELFGLFRASEISDLKVAQLNLEAGNANKQAGAATQRAGDDEVEIAELEKRADDARLATEQLEANIAPEILNGEQCSALKQVFKQFGPQNLDIETMSDDRDISFLATEFEVSSRDTGWSVKIFAKRRFSGKIGQAEIQMNEILSFDRGVAIIRFDGSDKKSDLACKAIDKILTGARIQCGYLSFDPPWEEPSIAAIPKDKLPKLMIPPALSFKLPGFTSLRQTETQYDEAYREPKKRTTIQIMVWPR